MRLLNNGRSSALTSDTVYKTLHRKRVNAAFCHAPVKILGGTILISLLLFDIYVNHSGMYSVDLYELLMWCAEMLLLVVSVAYTLKWLLGYTSQLLFPSYVDITLAEQSLLSVKDNEPGFRLTPLKAKDKASTPVLNYSPRSFHSSPNSSFQLANYSMSPLTRSGPVSASKEDSVHSSYLSAAHGSAQHVHGSASFGGASPAAADPLNRSNGARLRRSPTPKRSFLDSSVTSLPQLDAFLAEEAEKEQAEMIVQNDLNASAGYSFWGINRTVSDYIPVLKKFQYQMASRSSSYGSNNGGGSGGSAKTSNSEQISKYPANMVWAKLNISDAVLDIWIENFRYWVGQTIFQRLAKEIAKLNKELKSLGSEDSVVGEASLSTLKNLALVKSSLLPTLNNIVPYLEVSSHQDYLVHRLKTLGDDGCIAEFNWDGGETYSGKPWEMTLPTDSAIVMHFFCTYLDARIPANPKYPEGKSFSSLHFIQTPDKPNFSTRKDYLAIYQTEMNPPHYKVVVGEEVIDLPKGRNNMFYAILLFLVHVRDRENGLIGHVSFGSSGVNLLWILSEKYSYW